LETKCHGTLKVAYAYARMNTLVWCMCTHTQAWARS